MAETELLNRMYHAILEWFVKHGRAPHYVELADRLDLAAEETRRTLRELVDMGLPGVWQHPSTDYIESFAPFANLPTQYLITVRRRQRWYGQWGFESLAVCWLFPKQEVRIDCPCLDCGEPIRVRMKDGELLSVDPPAAVGHSNIPYWRWREDIARSWSQMNLFRSEEHVRRWMLFDPASEDGIRPIAEFAALFGLPMFRERFALDYLERLPALRQERLAASERFAKGSPFWAARPPSWYFTLRRGRPSYDQHLTTTAGQVDEGAAPTTPQRAKIVCRIARIESGVTRGLLILVARLTARQHGRIFSLCHYFAISKQLWGNESRHVGRNEMAGLRGKADLQATWTTAFKHGLAAIQKRREESVTTEHEETVRQQILDGLIADKGGDDQISTATKILAEVVVSNAAWCLSPIFRGGAGAWQGRELATG